MSQWMIYTKRADFNGLAKAYDITPITARIMINRGVKENEFESFLHGEIKDMCSPWLFKDMDRAVGLIEKKLAEGKHIRVIGDYDIDGVCATYILTDALRGLGARADMDIPHRVRDGYGLNRDIIDKSISEGADTIITCDNGIAAIEEIRYAKERGLTVIVTDHHEPPLDKEGKAVRVEGDAVIDPKQPDCPYPYKQLCGAAVAMKLMAALYESLGRKFDLSKYLEPAAIATIGDVVDLTGENRIIAKKGLLELKNARNAGIRALFKLCGVETEKLSAYHIGFIIGPCLNAGGRLETAKLAYRLMDAKSIEEAEAIAAELKDLNNKRKAMTDDGVELARLKALEKQDKNVLVLYIKNIHESIAGIVAGRIREEFYKPVIILTDTEDTDIVKGSGRSIEGYNMFAELSRCRELFLKFGGHEMAAGLSLYCDKIEAFEKMVNENETMTEAVLTEKLWMDLQLPFSCLSKEFIEELSILEPFGKANEKPLFAERGVELLGFNILGKNRNALKMFLRGSDKYPVTAMFFGDIEAFRDELIKRYGEGQFRLACTGRENDIRLMTVYYPQLNTYNGRTTVQIVIKAYRIV